MSYFKVWLQLLSRARLYLLQIRMHRGYFEICAKQYIAKDEPVSREQCSMVTHNKNRRTTQHAYDTEPRLSGPCKTTTKVPTHNNIPRIIIQMVSTWRDIRVGIGVCSGHCVHGARLTGLHCANDATATRAPRTLVLGL